MNTFSIEEMAELQIKLWYLTHQINSPPDKKDPPNNDVDDEEEPKK